MLVRLAPVVFSLAAHATVFGALYGGGAGRASMVVPQMRDEVTVDVVPDVAHPPDDESPVDEVTPAVRRSASSHATAGHTHPYPVPATHAEAAHDPATKHDHATANAHGGPDTAPPAPDPLTADARPTFSIKLSAATQAHGHGSGSPAGAAAGSPPEADPVVPESSVSAKARLVSSIPAAYPTEARHAELEADVTVDIVVGHDGRVEDARVARTVGHGFDEAAIRAIKQYRFAPAQREGRVVRVRMPWTVHFRLR